MSSLIITSGEEAGTCFQLADRPLAVGRDPARDIPIVDPRVSRKQCLTRRRGDDYVLPPFQRVNAVLVNGNEIGEAVVLRDRDKIELGHTKLRFRADDNPDRTNGLEHRKPADRRMRESLTISERR